MAKRNDILGRPLSKLLGALALVLALFIFLKLSAAPSSITHGAGNTKNPWSPFAIPGSMSLKPKKAIIATVLRQNEGGADLIVDMLPDWEPHIFMADGNIEDADALLDQHAKKTPLAFNRGREASTYLTYIITHYYNLPDYLVFLHGERYQTHNGE